MTGTGTTDSTDVTTGDAPFATGWARWRAERDEQLRDPHGWLSLVALHWLGGDPARLPEAPGRWSSDGTSVQLSAAAADGVLVAGTVVDGTVTLTPVEGAPGLRVHVGDLVLEVALRTGQHLVRVRDPRSATLRGFVGVPGYAPAAEWALPAVFTPYDAAVTVTTGAVVPGLRHHHQAQGTLAFTAPDGTEHELVAFAGKDGGLSVLFTDATSGVTTYAACRLVTVPAPDEGGRTTLDLNRAVNLPCAFTDYATCPVAPPENRLPLAVEAGEKLP